MKAKDKLDNLTEIFKQSAAYADVLKHRRDCPRWSKGFCLDCFGGGLTKFTRSLEQELKRI
jgi:hypothetical protein